MLKGEVAVNRHKHIGLFLHAPEQLSVLDTGSTGLRHCNDLMAIDLLGQATGRYTRREEFSRSDRKHSDRCFFEESDHLLTRDSGEPVEELVDRLPPSKYSMSVCTGTRVPRKTGVPPKTSGVEVMRGCLAVVITHPNQYVEF